MPSLLRATTRLVPEELVLGLTWGVESLSREAELPCLRRATSIKLDALFLFVGAPASECCFPVLMTLVLSGVTLHGLRWACLHVLMFDAARSGGHWNQGGHDITVLSGLFCQLVVVETQTHA